MDGNGTPKESLLFINIDENFKTICTEIGCRNVVTIVKDSHVGKVFKVLSRLGGIVGVDKQQLVRVFAKDSTRTELQWNIARVEAHNIRKPHIVEVFNQDMGIKRTSS